MVKKAKNFSGAITDDHMGKWTLFAIKGEEGLNKIIAIEDGTKKAWEKPENLWLIGKDEKATLNYLRALCCDPTSWGTSVNYQRAKREICDREVIYEIETII